MRKFAPWPRASFTLDSPLAPAVVDARLRELVSERWDDERPLEGRVPAEGARAGAFVLRHRRVYRNDMRPVFVLRVEPAGAGARIAVQMRPARATEIALTLVLAFFGAATALVLRSDPLGALWPAALLVGGYAAWSAAFWLDGRGTQRLLADTLTCEAQRVSRAPHNVAP
jgi:hypothetical protein